MAHTRKQLEKIIERELPGATVVDVPGPSDGPPPADSDADTPPPEALRAKFLGRDGAADDADEDDELEAVQVTYESGATPEEPKTVLVSSRTGKVIGAQG